MKNTHFDAARYPGYLKRWATKDLDVAKLLILDRDRTGMGLFFAHAALQKTLAAKICADTQRKPPWRGDLIKLANLAKIKLTKEQREFCKAMNLYHKEGLYPGLNIPAPAKEESRKYWLQAKKMVAAFSIYS